MPAGVKSRFFRAIATAVSNFIAAGASNVIFNPASIPAAWSATKAAGFVDAALNGIVNDLGQVTGVTGGDLVGFDAAGLPVPAGWSAAAAAADVQSAIDGVVDDLGQATGVTGGDLVGFDASGLPVPAGWSAAAAATDLQSAIDGMIDDLGQATGADGAEKIGFDSGAAPDLTATDVADAIDKLATQKGELGAANVWTSTNDFNGDITLGGNETWIPATDGQTRTFRTHKGTANENISVVAEATFRKDTSNATPLVVFDFGSFPTTQAWSIEFSVVGVEAANTDDLFVRHRTWSIGSSESVGRDNIADINTSDGLPTVDLDFASGVRLMITGLAGEAWEWFVWTKLMIITDTHT